MNDLAFWNLVLRASILVVFVAVPIWSALRGVRTHWKNCDEKLQAVDERTKRAFTK